MHNRPIWDLYACSIPDLECYLLGSYSPPKSGSWALELSLNKAHGRQGVAQRLNEPVFHAQHI